jgi:hypothetical protein
VRYTFECVGVKVAYLSYLAQRDFESTLEQAAFISTIQQESFVAV